MNLNESRTIPERGTIMKQTHVIAAVVAVVAMGILAPDASAFYHPGLGCWMQRDPGAGGIVAAPRVGAPGPAVGGQFIPRDQYADGMNLYQYVRSSPARFRDPSGLTVAEQQMWQNMINEIQGWINAGNPDASYHQQTTDTLKELIKYNQWEEYDWNTARGTDQQHYNYGKEQDLRSKLRGGLAVDAASGFVVIGSAIQGNEKGAMIGRGALLPKLYRVE